MKVNDNYNRDGNAVDDAEDNDNDVIC